jgi:hypothetical protein
MSDEPEIVLGGEDAPTTTTTGTTTTTAGPDDSLLDPVSQILQTRLWSADPMVVAAALKELGDMVDGDCNNDKIYETNQAIYNGAGAFAVPVAMKRCHASLEVQTQGCRTIYMCTKGNSSFGSSAVKFGALSVILFAMKQFSYDATLQAIAALALRLLAESDWQAVTIAFKKLGGAVLVVEAMTNFPKDAQVMLQVSNLIRYLSTCGEGLPEALVDEGALEALGTASRKFKEAGNAEHDAIREHAKYAINQLLSATSG